MDYIIDINTEIGPWGSSKSYVSDKLKTAKKDAVFVRINSLGGSVDHALSIASLLEQHGSVVCDFYGLNASAATLLSLTAKKVRIHEDALYLIHKPLVFILSWENMNEDDLDAYIQTLDSTKKALEVVTLTMAKMYMRRSGKSLKDILSLMKEERWLTAAEAVSWGFCDEIIRGKAAFTASYSPLGGLPSLPRGYSLDVGHSSLFSRLFGNSKNMNKEKISIKNYASLSDVLALSELDGGVTANSVELSVSQLQVLDDALDNLSSELEKTKTELGAVQDKLDAALASPGDCTSDVSKESDIPSSADEESLFAAVQAARDLYDKI